MIRKWIPLVLLSSSIQAAPLLITGQISSSEQQIVTAPMTDRWQIQVQWLMEEGQIANKGDLIAAFDSSSTKTQIKQGEESLATAKLRLKQSDIELKQALVEAQGRLEVAKLELERAKIEATLDSIEISSYEKGQYQLAYERAIFTKVKAEQEVNVKQQEYESGIAKQKIEIIKVEENLAYQRKMLDKVSVKAKVTGPVSHMFHPWNGEKITAGTLVQQSMQVISVQGEGSYQVNAWVHEVDVNRINLGDLTKLTLDAYPQKLYQGRISAIASQSEKRDAWSDGAYHLITVDFDKQPNQQLLPGMSVRVVVDKDKS